MFVLFYNLYMAMFKGYWTNYTYSQIFNSHLKQGMDALGTFLTSIFGNNVYTNLGTDFFSLSENSYINILSMVLATITSIGIVFMAVKGVKRIFGVFFYGVR